jgi:hypothetical protein
MLGQTFTQQDILDGILMMVLRSREDVRKEILELYRMLLTLEKSKKD